MTSLGKDLMTKGILPVLAAIAIAGCAGRTAGYPDGESRYAEFAPDGIPFRVADSSWTIDMRGNHRAVVCVEDTSAGAVLARLPWRRPDLQPDSKKVVVTDAGGSEVTDVLVTELTPEAGEVIFRPAAGEGTYYIYYLPYKWQTWYINVSDYLPAEYSADPAWAEKAVSGKEGLPPARVECFESASRFNFWTPMGLTATRAETEALREAAGRDMVVFPEDRAFPIQFSRYLPARWTKVPEASFKGLALRDEYYAWQLGVWAARKDLRNVRISFDGLRNGSSLIPAGEMTCFNLEGTSWDGSRLDFNVDVPKDRVQAMWCGVMIPRDARPGTYHGTAVVSAEGVEPQTISLEIKVSGKVIEDHGDSETWRHSRLRWLNSTIGLDNEPTARFKEMEVSGSRIEATGKSVVIGGNGMVGSAEVNGIGILSSPMRIVVERQDGATVFDAGGAVPQKKAAGLVEWTASGLKDGIGFELEGNMEFDGHLHFNVRMTSDEETPVKDIRLETVYSAAASEYMIGIGFDGGYRPERYSWDWKGPFDSYWTGGARAGMHTEFRGGTYHGPLLFAFNPPPPPFWDNDGKGRILVDGRKGKEATVTASTGPCSIGKVPKEMEFALTLTPATEPDPAKHFTQKYFHAAPQDFDRASEDGANICNIHHGQNLNPYINYPFIVRDSLIAFINHEHAEGRMVKLYYTMRELSAHCEELYAFHSLEHQITAPGEGGGNAWLCEHLVEDYWPAWYTSLDHFRKGDSDPALQMVGYSRYINYFLEGVRWMEQHYDLDGLYMDDLSCDRVTMKRLRKILDKYHEGALIDMHSNTWYSKGPANQYAEFFPYLDRLWFGESFRYDDMTPDQWFVTFSGIPFGQMSEMLQDGGNRFLGMVYGTTARHSWEGVDNRKSPVPMWKFWEKYRIQEARMLGYWDPACPVKTSDPEVKATAYVKDGETIVSIGNFSGRDKTVRLDIDWEALGIDKASASITAPFLKNFQEETTFRPGDPIPVKAKEGWMLLLRQK